jgi:hypothetical protein
MKGYISLFLLLVSLHANAQSPVIRAHLEPASKITVGQPVRLVVSVFVPNYFTGSPEFPEFEIENAIVVLPQDRPENSNTRIGDATYFGITQTYLIYPQQAGDFRVPPAKVSVPYAVAPPKSTISEVELPALSFHAEVPAAARDLPYFLPTTQLTLTERWSHSMNGLRVGDTVERTITITASKMQAMLIPPLEFEQPDGVRIYSGEPTVREQKTSHGDFVYGQRIQTAKYFIEKPGDHLLPPIELKWWNLSTGRLVAAVLPAIKISAIPNPETQAELPPPPEPVAVTSATVAKPHHYRKLAINLGRTLLLLTLVLFIVRLARQAYPYIASWAQRRKNSEPVCFSRLLRAARGNAANQTYAGLLRWLSVVCPGLPFDRIVDPSSELAHEIDTLAAAIYSGAKASETWGGDALVERLRHFRKELLRRRRQNRSWQSLSPLNPIPIHRSLGGKNNNL